MGEMLLCERKHGRAGLSAGPVHHREQGHGARRGPEIQHQQIHGTYRRNEIERFVWMIR